jgi:alpha-amylase
VAALSARDQIEIVGGGYYEPVLASLPERDRIGQRRRMSDELEALFGKRPVGAGWRSGLGAGPADIAVGGGYDWTILDDAHFRARRSRGGPLGPVHDRGPGPAPARVRTEQGLRYRIPFRTVEEVIDYLGCTPPRTVAGSG